jgi:hypothetical protein
LPRYRERTAGARTPISLNHSSSGDTPNAASGTKNEPLAALEKLLHDREQFLKLLAQRKRNRQKCDACVAFAGAAPPFAILQKVQSANWRYVFSE